MFIDTGGVRPRLPKSRFTTEEFNPYTHILVFKFFFLRYIFIYVSYTSVSGAVKFTDYKAVILSNEFFFVLIVNILYLHYILTNSRLQPFLVFIFSPKACSRIP